jgi:hypothetical protein
MADEDDPWSWTINHFSQSNPDGPEGAGHVPELLRRVADTIKSLGPVEVQDLTFATTVTAEGHEHSVTVYFHRPGSDSDRRMRLVQ